MLSVVIVTYGNRWEILKKVLQPLERSTSIDKVIVINNGVLYDISDYLIKNSFNKVSCFNLDKNYGSAYAYSFGLKKLHADEDTELIYLLDDDNLVTEQSITTLTEFWNTEVNDKNRTALLSLRKDRKYLEAIANGKPVKNYFPPLNSFLGFNVFTFLSRKLYKIFDRSKEVSLRRAVEIPMAPYGGLFFSRSLLELIGFPDERFYLYADDFEFTYRITRNEGKILLIPASEIEDIDQTWLNKTTHGIFSSRYLQQNDFRSYYSIRNNTYFMKNHMVTNRFLFRINLIIYSVYLCILALFSGKMNAYRSFNRAVRAGVRGNFENHF